jgi:hypothetical protein
MSETLNNSALSARPEAGTAPGSKRAHAVAAAMELIAARVSAGDVHLENEMQNLSKYADQIQEALTVR